MKKVYCENCIYIGRQMTNRLHIYEDVCKHEENIVEHTYYKGSWYTPDTGYVPGKYRDCPSKLNKNNDCKWYTEKKKWSLFSTFLSRKMGSRYL